MRNQKFFILLTLLLLTSVYTWAEETVSGKIFDGRKRPLEIATVRIKGATQGIISFGGNYTIKVKSLQDTLLFVESGYKPCTIALNGRDTVDVVLKKRIILRDPEYNSFSDLFKESISCSLFSPYFGLQGSGWRKQGYAQSAELGLNVFFLQASINTQYSCKSNLTQPFDCRLFFGLTTTILQAHIGYAFVEDVPIYRLRSEWVLPVKQIERNTDWSITGFIFYEQYLKNSFRKTIGIGFNIIAPFSYRG